MECLSLTSDIVFFDLGVYLKNSKTFIISDIHLGFEDSLHRDGFFIPKSQLSSLKKRINNIFSSLDIAHIILNGDIKHEFVHFGYKEHDNLKNFLALFSDKKISCILGNHDLFLAKNLKDYNLSLIPYILIDYCLIVHGDRLFTKLKTPQSILKKAKTIIIGHEHPAIILRSENRREKFKCFLVGKTADKKRHLIVMPSFNDLTEGTNILQEELISPYLQHNLSQFHCIVCGNELLDFGKVKSLK